MKMEQTECSETSPYKIQTPGNYPEENIQHSEHSESLKSRKLRVIVKIVIRFRAKFIDKANNYRRPECVLTLRSNLTL